MLRFAARTAPVPVFVVAGVTGRVAAELLHLDKRVRVVASPRHAMLLLIVGTVDAQLQEPLQRLHDALPPPRATLWWDLRGDIEPLLPAVRVEPDGDVAAVCVQRAEGFLDGSLHSETPLLPDVERHPWRGVGPYGQGGTGMTGGHPYGRALANRADDLRDRLALDAVPLTVGPFFPALPDGMVLRVVFQGDVVQDLEVLHTPTAIEDAGDVFRRAIHEPTAVRVLEEARAASHLRWLGRAVRLVGLPALGERALRLSLNPEPSTVRRLVRLVRRVAPVVTKGVGVLSHDDVSDRGLGPVARASGARDDARADDPAYRALGFEPVVGRGGDVWARWRQRLEEIQQSVDLATKAGSAVTGGDGRPIEGPNGPVGVDGFTAMLTLLPEWLQGSEWGDAVTAIASLDLNPDGQRTSGEMAA